MTLIGSTNPQCMSPHPAREPPHLLMALMVLFYSCLKYGFPSWPENVVNSRLCLMLMF